MITETEIEAVARAIATAASTHGIDDYWRAYVKEARAAAAALPPTLIALVEAAKSYEAEYSFDRQILHERALAFANRNAP